MTVFLWTMIVFLLLDMIGRLAHLATNSYPREKSRGGDALDVFIHALILLPGRCL